MRITYDIVTKELQVDTSMVQPFGTNIVAALRRYGRKVPFQSLSFGANVEADGVPIFNESFPRPGQKWLSSDQDILWSAPIRWSPDAAITVQAWIGNGRSALRVDRNTTQIFNVPRPPKPYPSWTWGGTEWVAPEPLPNQGQDFEWDEDQLKWVAV